MSTGDFGFGLQEFGTSPFGEDPATDPATSGPLGAPYLAVDIQPDVLNGVFTLDVSELDGPDVLAWTEENAGQWVNVVCDVTQVSLQRGVTRLQGVMTQAESGTVQVQVTDYGGQLDPLRSANAVHKGTPFRLRAWGYQLDPDTWELIDWSTVLFTGEVDTLAAVYMPDSPAEVTVTAVDLVASLVAWEAEGRPGDGVGAGDNLLQRVQRVLDEADRGTVHVAGSDTSYVATLNPTRLQHPWEDITAAADAELGMVWVDAENRLVCRARDSAITGPVRGTLSDLHGEAVEAPHCCMSTAAVVYGTELLANRAVGSRRLLDGEDPTTALVVREENVPSQVRYGVNAVDRTGQLELQTDAQLTPWAQAVVSMSNTPELRVDSVDPSPTQNDLDEAAEQWPAVLSTDIGDRWRFLFHPQAGGAVERMVTVLGVDLLLTPDTWQVRWTTADQPATP